MMVMAWASVAALVSAPTKKLIFASNSDRAQGALGGIVDGHATVSEQQAEGLLPIAATAKGFG